MSFCQCFLTMYSNCLSVILIRWYYPRCEGNDCFTAIIGIRNETINFGIITA